MPPGGDEQGRGRNALQVSRNEENENNSVCLVYWRNKKQREMNEFMPRGILRNLFGVSTVSADSADAKIAQAHDCFDSSVLFTLHASNLLGSFVRRNFDRVVTKNFIPSNEQSSVLFAADSKEERDKWVNIFKLNGVANQVNNQSLVSTMEASQVVVNNTSQIAPMRGEEDQERDIGSDDYYLY